MLFLTAFLWNAFRFVLLMAVSVGGVFLGIKLRKSKDAKN